MFLTCSVPSEISIPIEASNQICFVTLVFPDLSAGFGLPHISELPFVAFILADWRGTTAFGFLNDVVL